MIGLDTNVLVRFLTKDSEAEVLRVLKLLNCYRDDHESIYIADTVLLEIIWVLATNYKHTKAELIKVLELLNDMREFKFSDRIILTQAIELYKNGAADFADYFIILKNQQAGCEYTYSFDKKLLKEQIAVPIPN